MKRLRESNLNSAKEMLSSKKLKLIKNRLRRLRADIKSHWLSFSNPKVLARKIQRILKEGCCHIRDNDFEDHLKAAPPNPVKSAKLSIASFNIYYGGNIPGSEKSIDGVETVERYAYASGSGKGTIGIDPQTFRLNPLPKYFEKLKAAVKELPDSLLTADYKKFDYNAMSVKIYYKVPGRPPSSTGFHSDVLYNKKDNQPTRNKNSQKPGTPVLIFTYGGRKHLVMARTTQGNKVGIIDKSEVHFTQTNTRLFVLDGEDEKWNNGQKWIHRSTYDGEEGGMIITFMLRVVQNQTRVITSDSTLFDKGKKNEDFDAVRETYKQAHDYEENVAKINVSLAILCDRPIP